MICKCWGTGDAGMLGMPSCGGADADACDVCAELSCRLLGTAGLAIRFTYY